MYIYMYIYFYKNNLCSVVVVCVCFVVNKNEYIQNCCRNAFVSNLIYMYIH